MKKFFSLLLALTMVLSLVVVPAEAAEDPEGGGSPAADTLSWGAEPTLTISNGSETITNGASVEKGTALTFTIGALSIKKGDSAATADTDYTVEYSWSGSVSGSANSANYTPDAAGSVTATCTITIKKDGAAVEAMAKTLSASITVTDKNAAFKTALISANAISYNGRTASYASDKLVQYTWTGDSGDGWKASTSIAGYTGISCSSSEGGITVTGKNSDNADVTCQFSIELKNASFGIKATIANQVTENTIISGGSVKLEVKDVVLPAGYSLKWYNGETPITGNVANLVLTANAAIKCEAYLGEAKIATSSELNIAVINDTFKLADIPAIRLAKGETKALTAPAFLDGSTPVTGVTGTWTSNNSAIAAISSSTVEAKAAGSATLTYSLTYQGKTYTKSAIVSVVSLDCALNATANGASASYYSYAQLASAAQSKIAAMLNVQASAVTISGMSIKGTPNACGGAFTLNGGNFAGAVASNGYIYFTPSRMQIGTASFVLTVTAGGINYDVTFTIPVTPIAATFEAQYPQATSANTYGRNYAYTVTPPTGYDLFYVVNKTGVAPTDFAAYASYLTTGATYTTLYDSDFVNGQCTLYVIAWNSNYNNYYGTSYSYGKYYSGALTVYQNSTDIEYTAVAGDTVKFKNNDFTNFLNEITKPTTTTNTVNSSYYSFSHVTFSNFSNSNQGVLYYGTTAMGTYGRSSFTAATQITDPSQVSFAVKDNTTSKQIVISFTLYADRYSRTGTKLQDDVSFPGRVVINVVREDVTVTVSPGDVVTLNAGDFLSYLNGYSNAYRNATIDYVTFDQSALTSNTSAPGALYPYYSSVYSYSSTPVKSTDRFYYSARTTASAVQQLTLGNVVFRTTAPAYTMVGETVYIPFTIKLANSNNTLPGTLAVKLTQAINFTDVKPGQYYYDAVKWAVGKQITQGMTATTFGPDTDCTRAQIVTFLWRAAGCPTPKTYYSNFVDVYSGMGSDYYQAILWAVGEGITTGTDTTHFSPNASCTRAQIVTFLWRYAGKQTGYAANYFTDVNATTHSVYYQAILWATNNGITSGLTTTTFGPEATCTRGHAVTFLYRLSNPG